MRTTFRRKMDKEAIYVKLMVNLKAISPSELASVYNDVLGFSGTNGEKVTLLDDDLDDPTFVTEHPLEEMQMKYIALGPYCWGKGDTLAEAWKNCRTNWPNSQGKADKGRTKFYHAPETIYVNETGGLSGPKEDHEKIVEVDGAGKPV